MIAENWKIKVDVAQLVAIKLIIGFTESRTKEIEFDETKFDVERTSSKFELETWDSSFETNRLVDN